MIVAYISRVGCSFKNEVQSRGVIVGNFYLRWFCFIFVLQNLVYE